MWKNYFKTSYRFLYNNRFFTIINLFSLTVGISIFTIIFLVYHTKTTKDSFHTNYQNIYRIVNEIDAPGKDPYYTSRTSESFATALKNTIPAVETVVQYGSLSGTVTKEEDKFQENIQLVTPGFFEVFSFPFEQGKGQFGSDFNSVVLSKDIAVKYFGKRNPTGKIIQLKLNTFEQEFKVIGVLDSRAYNSKIDLDIVIPNVFADKIFSNPTEKEAPSRHFANFVVVNKGADVQQLKDGTVALLPDEFKDQQAETQFDTYIQSVAVSNWMIGLPNDESTYLPLYIILSLAFIILLISCVNFSTLTIGNAFKRTREVGVRKVNGAFSGQIKIQFLMESMMTAVLAGIISFGAIFQIIPFFNNINAQFFVPF